MDVFNLLVLAILASYGAGAATMAIASRFKD